MVLLQAKLNRAKYYRRLLNSNMTCKPNGTELILCIESKAAKLCAMCVCCYCSMYIFYVRRFVSKI